MFPPYQHITDKYLRATEFGLAHGFSLSLLPNVDHKIAMYDNLGPKTLYGHLTGTLGGFKIHGRKLRLLIYFTHTLYL